MTAPARTLLVGAAAALAVSLPAALVAQIAATGTDDELPAPVIVGLAALVVAGGIVGGWVVRRRRATWPVAAGAGSAALVVVAALGVLRRVVAGEGHGAGVLLAAGVVGALAGGTGWALDRARAARTRP